jgi:hypothetical protein
MGYGMVKVVVAKLKGGTSRDVGSRNVSVGKKRVRDEDGQIREIRMLDARSATFGADLTYVFRKNVSKARDENKLVTGVRDIAPSKG